MASLRHQTRISASSSSGSRRPKYKRFHEVPLTAFYELAKHLNADRKWPVLAGHMKYEHVDIANFGNATSHEGGPAENLLKSYCRSNGETQRVFEYMHRMKYYVGMNIIKDYVDPNEWYRLEDDDTPEATSGALYVPRSTASPLVSSLPEERPETKKINFQDTDLGRIAKIPHAELAKATQGFSGGRILGSGGFGIVYRGRWKSSEVAVKKLKVSETRSLEHVRQVLTELHVLEKCRFDYIVNLYGVSVDKADEACLVYEFMPGGSLDDRLKRKNPHSAPLTWSQRINIARGTACGLNFLHTFSESPLVHGDVKPANILLDENLKPKLGDFGLTKEGPAGDQTHREVTSVAGTPRYLPEEYVYGKKLSYEVDVYSFGLVLLELATGLRVYDEKRSPGMLNQYIGNLRGVYEHRRCQDRTGGKDEHSEFETLIELGLECSALLKSDRPYMGKVLDILMGEPSPRSAPTTSADNLQLPSSVPPAATTNLSRGQEVRPPAMARTHVLARIPMAERELPDLSLLNVFGKT